MGARLTGILLVHGVGTGPRVWDDVRAVLRRVEVSAPERPASGSLPHEVAFLEGPATGRIYGGVSGGATLGLALLAAGVAMARAVLHEPAPGSLVPGILAPVRRAFDERGVDGFGTALYGASWSRVVDRAAAVTVAGELAMFQAFEPEPPVGAVVPVVITVGARSSPERHLAAERVATLVGAEVVEIAGAGHAVHLERPAAFARLLAP